MKGNLCTPYCKESNSLTSLVQHEAIGPAQARGHQRGRLCAVIADSGDSRLTPPVCVVHNSARKDGSLKLSRDGAHVTWQRSTWCGSSADDADNKDDNKDNYSGCCCGHHDDNNDDDGGDVKNEKDDSEKLKEEKENCESEDSEDKIILVMMTLTMIMIMIAATVKMTLMTLNTMEILELSFRVLGDCLAHSRVSHTFHWHPGPLLEVDPGWGAVLPESSNRRASWRQWRHSQNQRRTKSSLWRQVPGRLALHLQHGVVNVSTNSLANKFPREELWLASSL